MSILCTLSKNLLTKKLKKQYHSGSGTHGKGIACAMLLTVLAIAIARLASILHDEH